MNLPLYHDLLLKLFPPNSFWNAEIRFSRRRSDFAKKYMILLIFEWTFLSMKNVIHLNAKKWKWTQRSLYVCHWSDLRIFAYYCRKLYIFIAYKTLCIVFNCHWIVEHFQWLYSLTHTDKQGLHKANRKKCQWNLDRKHFFVLLHKLRRSEKIRFPNIFERTLDFYVYLDMDSENMNPYFFLRCRPTFPFHKMLIRKMYLFDAGTVHESSLFLHRVCTVLFAFFILQLGFMISLKGHLNKGAYYSSP